MLFSWSIFVLNKKPSDFKEMDYFYNRNGLRPNWRGFNIEEVIRAVYMTSRCKKKIALNFVWSLFFLGVWKCTFLLQFFLEKIWERREDLSRWAEGFVFEFEKSIREGYEFLLEGILHQEFQIFYLAWLQPSWFLEALFLVNFQQQIDYGKRHLHPFSL